MGNHDVQNRMLYQGWYGPTYYSFAYGPAYFIFLDTEIETCAIDAPQRSMLERALQAALQDDAARHIFIFMHKTLFLKNDALFALDRDEASPNDWVCHGNPAFPFSWIRSSPPPPRKNRSTCSPGMWARRAISPPGTSASPAPT